MFIYPLSWIHRVPLTVCPPPTPLETTTSVMNYSSGGEMKPHLLVLAASKGSAQPRIYSPSIREQNPETHLPGTEKHFGQTELVVVVVEAQSLEQSLQDNKQDKGEASSLDDPGSGQDCGGSPCRRGGGRAG